MPSDDPADLRAVRGIGPKAAARLKQAGVADLATLAQTPVNELAAALAGLPGKFDAGRIDRENWITQAAALAAAASRSAADGPERDAAQVVRHIFTVDIRLRQAGHVVMSTKITHIPSGDEDAWGAWDPDRLIAFIRERSGLQVSGTGSGPVPAHQAGRATPPATGAWQAEPEQDRSAAAVPEPEPRPFSGPDLPSGPGPRPSRVSAYAMVPATGPGSAGSRSRVVTAIVTFSRDQLNSADSEPVMVRAEVLARQLLAGGSVVVGRGAATADPGGAGGPVRLKVPCDLSPARPPLVLCAAVRVLVPDDGERPPVRDLTGARLLISS